MRLVDIDEIKDEEEKKRILKKYQSDQQNIQDKRNSYLQQTGLDKIYSGDYSNSNDGFNTAGRNDFAVQPSLWEQIKTTAGNMFGNVGYGLGNGLIGFAQNERRNKTASNALSFLNKANISNPASQLFDAFGNLGKSLESTLDFTLKDNNTYNSLKKANEDNKNTILNFIDEKLQNQEDINNENIQKNIQETTNPIGQKLVEIAPAIGQIIPSAIPGAGALYSVGSATDSYYDEAKSRGMNDEQASNYSQIMGVAEGLTEQIGVGKLVKGGKISKKSISKAFKEIGIGLSDNFIQEAIIEPISELTTKVTAGDQYLKNDYRTAEGWKQLGKDMLQSGFDGALVSGMVGMGSIGIGKASNLVDRMKKGYNPNINEVRETFDEARKNGVDIDKIIQDELKKSMEQVLHNNTNRNLSSQQDTVNRLNEIVQNDKYLSQEDKEAMIYATNDLASKNQLDSNNTLEAINQIKQMSQLSQEQNEQLDIGKKYLSGRKEIYNKYRSVTNYDNSIVQQAKDVVPSNKQGKRTKEQWLDVAKYIGTNIADKSNSEIQEIAYKSWQEETPNNSATLNKQGKKYVKFMSDEWIDTIYDAVEKQRQKSGYVANNDTVNALDNFYKEYTSNQTAQNKNIQNNIDTSSLNLVDSAKAYNINGNDETIQSINQKLNDRGITSRFDGNLFTNADGKPNKNINALWRTTTDENGNTHREIIFNPYVDGNINEQKTMQQVTIHEMVHDMTGTKDFEELSKSILDKNSTREGYSNARSNLEEMYSQVYDKNSKDFKNLVDEEEVADTLAQKLGDQDFINSLNKEKPNVFKRIYDWVVDKLNKFTGSKNEKLYWEDVKNKFESAYRQDYQGTSNSNRFSIKTDSNGNKFVKIDTHQDIFKEKTLSEQTKIAKQYILDNFRDKGLKIDDENVNVTSKTANEYTHPKNQLPYKTKQAKIKASTELDNMLNISDYQYSSNDDGRHRFAKDGWDYYKTVFEVDGVKFEGLVNIAKSGNKKTFYDVTNIKRISQNRSASDKSFSTSLTNSNNSIPTSNNNVNTTNNNSMQENAKNTKNEIRTSIKPSGAWQSFLENQIGPSGKGKTVQELRLPTKENWNTIKQQNIIKQNNKERLKDIGVTKNSDIVTNGNNENIDEEKIANILTEMPTKEKEKSRALAILKANILDKGIVFEELSRKTKNRELQGKWDYTLTASARGQNAIGRPRYEFDSKTKTQKLISKSLESIREEVGKNVVDFNEYMYHQLNIDRMTLEERFGGDTGINYERKNKIENKPVFGKIVTAKVSQDIVNKYEKNNPEFKKWAKDVYDFLDANTQELVKTGVISEDTRQLFKEMYPHYVPISRVDNKGNAIAVPLDTRRTGVNSPIKKAKGGNSDIKPLFETIADRTLQTYRASARNNFGVELLNTLRTVQNAESIDVDNILEEITNSEDGNLLRKGKGTEPPSFTVFVNGEKVTFEISKDMYDALKPISEGLSYRNKTLNKISNFRRGVLTEYNPVFMITNSLKDIQDVVVNSQHTAKTISKLPEAYSQIIDKGYWYNEYIQNGGEQNSYFNANDGSFENDQKVNMKKNIATIPLKAISKVNNIIEMSPRLAEYIASREKGRSIETSMLDASRVTTNFKAGGNVTKFLNRNGATFLNASVQGAMQQVRNIQEAKVKGLKGWTALACKYAVAGIPAILLNNILWKDDEDYEDLQDYVKDSYYCIAKYGDGKFIRIPKGRTTATIQKIISNASEYITDDKKLNIDNLAKDFWEDLQFTMDNLAPNNPLDNNIISPIIQAVTNTSWYGEDIVPSRLQNKPPAEQYDESTDKFSKWLGEKLKVSPYKINYLLDQYGGGISDIVLPMLTPQAENDMIEDKFTTDAVMKSRYPSDFFEKSDEINVSANSDKATDLDIVKNKYMTNISKEMSKLYEEKRKIENSNVNDDIKKDQLKEVQKEINKLAKAGIEESDKVKVDGNTAKAGDELYYKYHGEWTKLDEDEKEKTKNISLKSYADFKNKMYNETQRQKDSGELEEDKQLKNTTKSKILLESSYSDKDKLELYKNYISSTDKKVSVAVEKLGMPIDVYLDYKSNKFENDKDEDGETISGTKKDKVYDYVNRLNDVDLIYKYMMVKMSDINDSYADKAILNFVDNNKAINFEERNEILETLGFDVDKYGNVQNLIFIPIKSRIK